LLPLPVSVTQGWAFDRLIASLGAGGAVDSNSVTLAIAAALVVAVVCHVGRMTFVWCGNLVMNRVSLEIVRDLTDTLHRKLQRLPLAYFDQQQTGQLMARITSDVGSLLIFLGSGSMQLVSDLVLAAGIACVLLWIRWQLAVICFIVVPLYAFNHRLFAGRINALSAKIRGQLGSIYALLSERISAVRVVRSFAQEEAEIRQMDQRIDAHRELNRAGLRISALQAAVSAMLAGAGTMAVLVCGVALIRRDMLTVGDLFAFSAMVAQLYNPLTRLIQFQSGAAATRVAVDRMMEVLEAPESIVERSDALPIQAPRGRLVFKDVAFSYRPGGPRIIDGVSLTVEPGMRVGLIGPSGAGKSTLLALSPRLYDVDGGSISFDGCDVRGLRLAELRRSIIVVPQQAVLFQTTLRANLLYAAPLASANMLHKVLEALDLDELIKSLPLGLDTPVGDRGVTLSGGQRQRLALARALLANPSALLLDDCTSALDAETEARVCAAIDDLLPGRTRLTVSHKLTSLRSVDWILALENGRVVEQGRPEELLCRSGVFAQAHRRQTGVFEHAPDGTVFAEDSWSPGFCRPSS
jgi:ABC-type multidrug transport system fused ATPase/permease subunit